MDSTWATSRLGETCGPFRHTPCSYTLLIPWLSNVYHHLEKKKRRHEDRWRRKEKKKENRRIGNKGTRRRGEWKMLPKTNGKIKSGDQKLVCYRIREINREKEQKSLHFFPYHWLHSLSATMNNNLERNSKGKKIIKKRRWKGLSHLLSSTSRTNYTPIPLTSNSF